MSRDSVSPAEERAEREGLPVVCLLPHDAMGILQGHPTMVRFAKGGEVLVRLYTAEEWMPLQHAAADEHGTERVSMARAVELTKPLRMPS